MRILYATMQFGRGYGQGTERYVAMLAEGAGRRGHDAVVLAGDPERRGPVLAAGEGVETSPRTLYYPCRGWMSVVGLAPAELRPILDRERPDVVHVANPAHVGIGLMTAAREAGIPVVVTVMDFWWLCPKHTLLHHSRRICDANVPWRECIRCIAADDTRATVRAMATLPIVRSTVLPAAYFAKGLARGAAPGDLRRWMHRQAILLESLDRADAIIFPSHAARETLSPRLSHQRVHQIPYGLEPRWFEAARPRPPSDGPRDPAALTIGYAGALAGHKGPHLLLEAVRQLGWTRTRLRIAGGGAHASYADRLRELAAGSHVEFVGRVPSSEMPAFLASLDLLVMPSLWPENLPIVVLEALAVGTPVLASDVAGVREAVPETMRFAPGSAEVLARKLSEWATDPQMSPATSAAVSTADEMVERTLQTYAQAQAVRQSEPKVCSSPP